MSPASPSTTGYDVSRAAPLLLLLVCACVARPNRTEPKWAMTPATRAETTVKMHDITVPETGVECGKRELLRVRNFNATVERELWESGFEILKAEDDPVDGHHVDAHVEIAKLDCRDALRGDLTLTIERDRTELAKAHREGVIFSNFRVAANQLVDDILMSESFVAKLTSPVATSSTSTVTPGG